MAACQVEAYASPYRGCGVVPGWRDAHSEHQHNDQIEAIHLRTTAVKAIFLGSEA
ncbi:hypothetical protein IG631_20890 [Alternaria alternata]|nr:hypothetical protein IG631_20890 [Alternaria alternata]